MLGTCRFLKPLKDINSFRATLNDKYYSKERLIKSPDLKKSTGKLLINGTGYRDTKSANLNSSK